MAFVVAENGNRQLEDLSQADFGCLLERLLLSVSKKFKKWEFCKFKIPPIVVFVIMIQSIFPSWALAPTHCTIVDASIYFLLLLTSAFLVTNALLCLYDKQNNTRSLFECSTRHFISTRAHTLFSKNSARLCIHNMTCAVSLLLKVLSSLAARIQNYQLRLSFRSIPI